MEPEDLISQVRSGVVQITPEVKGKKQGGGSGFVVKGGIVTNSHVLRAAPPPDAFLIRPSDCDPDDASSYLRIPFEDLKNRIEAETTEGSHDYAYLRLDDPLLHGRYVFELADWSTLKVGERIVFLGFPFGMTYLTAHIGYVSSLHTMNRINIIQIDGSVNGGNSGGPLLDLKTGKVAGIVTRAVTGLIEQQFNELLTALRTNQDILRRGTLRVAGLDHVEAIRKVMACVERIAVDLKRTANVGIGYAFSAEYVSRFVK